MAVDKGLLGGSTVLMLLSLLSDKDCYGYEIIKELDERSETVFQFKEGTLYPVLHKMESDGYGRSYKKEGENGKKRTYYSITDKGILQLQREKEKWAEFTVGVNKVLKGTTFSY